MALVGGVDGCRDGWVLARMTSDPTRVEVTVQPSVFPAPVRAVLGAATYDEARELSLAAHGKQVSKQAFGLLPKIREVDQLLREDESAVRRVREIHPEVSFCVWNGDQPMAHPKRSSLGLCERLRLVESRFAGEFETAR